VVVAEENCQVTWGKPARLRRAASAPASGGLSGGETMWKKFVLLLTLASAANAQNYSIDTVAGGGAIVTAHYNRSVQ
jgi:hypothetical protein